MKLGRRPLFHPGRIYAIGDVHGEATKLARMLKLIEPELRPEDHVVFAGDLVDAGPSPRRTLRIISDFAAKYQTHLIWGNHEQMLMLFLKGYPDSWLANGGERTIRQFLAGEEEGTELEDVLRHDGTYDLLKAGLPYYETEDILITHAPISGAKLANPREGLLEELGASLRWDFVSREDEEVSVDKVFVCGHQHRNMRAPRFYPPNRIFLDSGAGYHKDGNVACVRLPDIRVYLSNGQVY